MTERAEGYYWVRGRDEDGTLLPPEICWWNKPRNRVCHSWTPFSGIPYDSVDTDGSPKEFEVLAGPLVSPTEYGSKDDAIRLLGECEAYLCNHVDKDNHALLNRIRHWLSP